MKKQGESKVPFTMGGPKPPAPKASESILQPVQESIYLPPPSDRGQFGVENPVRIQPKLRTLETMKFDGIESLPGLLKWLGSAFYALTDGDPVTVEGTELRNSKKDGDMPLTHLMLMIVCPVTNSLFAVEEGHWIVRDPMEGYSVLREEVMRKKYDFREDLKYLNGHT